MIEARTPGTNSEFDVRITVPDSMLVEIEDGSGSIEVRSVAGLRVSDGSGDVDVSDVGENLVIGPSEKMETRGEGLIASYIHLGGKVGVLVEVGCEKADTANAEAFKTLVGDLTLHIAALAPQHLNSDDVPADVIAGGNPARVIKSLAGWES